MAKKNNNNRPGGKHPNSPRYSDRYGPGHVNPYLGGQTEKSPFIREMEERQEAARQQFEKEQEVLRQEPAAAAPEPAAPAKQEAGLRQRRQDAAQLAVQMQNARMEAQRKWDEAARAAGSAQPRQGRTNAGTARRRSRSDNSPTRAVNDPALKERLRQIQEQALIEAKEFVRKQGADLEDVESIKPTSDVRMRLSRDNRPLIAIESSDTDGRKKLRWVPVVLTDEEMETFFPAREPDVKADAPAAAAQEEKPAVSEAAPETPAVEPSAAAQPEAEQNADEAPAEGTEPAAEDDISYGICEEDDELVLVPIAGVDDSSVSAVAAAVGTGIVELLSDDRSDEDDEGTPPAPQNTADMDDVPFVFAPAGDDGEDTDEEAADAETPEEEAAEDTSEQPDPETDSDDGTEETPDEPAEDEAEEEPSDDAADSDDEDAAEEIPQEDDADSADEPEDEQPEEEAGPQDSADDDDVPAAAADSAEDGEDFEEEPAEEISDEEVTEAEDIAVDEPDDIEDSDTEGEEETGTDDYADEPQTEDEPEAADEAETVEEPEDEDFFPYSDHRRRRSRPDDVYIPETAAEDEDENLRPTRDRRISAAPRPSFDELETSSRYAQSRYTDEEEQQDDTLFLRREKTGTTALFVLPEGAKLPKYIDDDDFVEHWLGEEEEDMATVKKRRRRRIAAFIGAAMMVLALIGSISVARWGLGLLGNIGSSESQKEIYAEYISPVVMSEVPVFEAWDAIPQEKLLQSAVFSVLMDTEVTYERDDIGNFIIPSTDIVNEVKELYGAYGDDATQEEEINDKIRSTLYGSVSEDTANADVYYVDMEDSFHVADALSGPAPQVTQISKRDNTVTLDVEYLEDLETGSGAMLYSRQFILTTTDDGYYIQAIRELEEDK